jgi:hypothetical protein
VLRYPKKKKKPTSFNHHPTHCTKETQTNDAIGLMPLGRLSSVDGESSFGATTGSRGAAM